MRPRPLRPTCSTLILVAVVAASVLAAACSSDDSSKDSGSSTTAAALPTVARLVDLRPLHVENQRIVDDQGREVLLRGANVNALGEYYQGDPAVEPTAPVTDADWDAMAAHGLSVVRLIMSWSLLEPSKGQIDQSYIDTVKEAVEAANERGLYVVLDMHQDAWGMSSATPAGTVCPDGTVPAIGWDGAPEWATITDGATTCRLPDSERESAPAVQRAFANFYANTDGINDQLTDVWAAVATAFADQDGVAGYDLFNEPNAAEPTDANEVAYSQWVADTIAAIRAAEKEADARSTSIFVEPLQLFPLPGNNLHPELIQDDNLVFAPHNYAESISDILTVEQTFQVDQNGADALKAALWIGEYGFWDTSAETLEVATRFAAQEDARALGGAWWQWRQTCGDPHSVAVPGGTRTENEVHLITRTCPGDTDAGPTEEFLRILGRAYPRAAPGHITVLRSDPTSGDLTVTGTGAEVGGELVVWLPEVPGTPDAQPFTTDGLDDVTLQAVQGGRILTASTTAAEYTLAVNG